MAQSDRHFEHTDPGALSPSPRLYEKARTICFALIILGLVGVVIGWAMPDTRAQFYHSYLVSWSAVWTTLMGVLFFVMLLYLFDAGWSTVIRRPAEQMLVAMPVVILLAIPVVVGSFSGNLQRWVHTDPADDHLLYLKSWYLNTTFMAIRFVIYPIVWIWLAHVMRTNSLRQDKDGAAKWTVSSRKWSAGGIILGVLTASLCTFDLLMALDHHWFSTVFPVYVLWGGMVGGICAVTLISLSLKQGVLRDYIGSDQVHDLGKLVFAFSVFWAYIAFSQYFLIWYGNIPEETVYYIKRWTGITPGGEQSTWWIVSSLVMVLRFGLPFFILMSANVKRNPKILGAMCVISLAAHWLDQYWMVQPEMLAHSDDPTVHATVLHPPLAYIWIDLSALALIVGACGAVYFTTLRKHALLPVMDPRLVEALSAEHVEEIEHADME